MKYSNETWARKGALIREMLACNRTGDYEKLRRIGQTLRPQARAKPAGAGVRSRPAVSEPAAGKVKIH